MDSQAKIAKFITKPSVNGSVVTASVFVKQPGQLA